MSTDVTVDVNAGVAVLTLNRPEHLNAYTAEMGALLSAAYRDCDNDDNVRAIVITGAGRAFCAGADFSGSASPFDSPPDDGAFSASPIDPAAFELRKPVIAAVNGHAIGIGLTIALQADMRIVADDAKYGVVQVRRGVIPDCMSHWTLAQLTNLGVAAEVLLTGRTFSGGEAVGWGIANRALPAAEVLDLAMDIARDIATNVAPMSAALCKRLLWDTAINGYTPRQVASLETQLHHRVMGTDDAREGVTAFLERRTPPHILSMTARERLKSAMPSLKERAKTLVQLDHGTEFLYTDGSRDLDAAAVKILVPEARALLARTLPKLEATDWSAAALESAARSFAEEAGLKLGDVAQPLRAALTGKTASPPLFEMLSLLGREESLIRLRAYAA